MKRDLSVQTREGWATAWTRNDDSEEEYGVQWPGSSAVHYFDRAEMEQLALLLTEIVR